MTAMRKFVGSGAARASAAVVIASIAASAAAARDGSDVKLPEGCAPRDVIYRLKPGAGERDRRELLDSVRATADRELWPGLISCLEIPTDASLAEAIAKLRADPRVLYAEPNGRILPSGVPNDPDFSKQWALQQVSDVDVDAPEAWDLATGAPSVVVAVIDSGIDYAHPDLAANVWVNPGEIPANGIDDDLNGWVDDVHGIDAANGDGDPMDDYYHGTFCAGVLGAVGNDALGMTGACQRVQLMALKFILAAGYGWSADAITCLNYAVANGARISSNSWNNSSYEQPLYDAIVAAQSAGHLFVAAAGNYSNDSDAIPSYPAAYSLAGIVSVASTGRNDALSSFSNWGAVSVDLAAPGESIRGCYPGGGYLTGSGTSASTPFVAAAAALLWEAGATDDPQQVKQWILDSVEPNSSLAGKCVTGGRLNLAAALAKLPRPVALASKWEHAGATGARQASALASCADVDGDGADEVLIGAPDEGSGGAAVGAVRLLSGRRGTLLRTWLGDTAGDQFGRGLADAGDVDGDGVTDFILGAPGDSRLGADTGEASIYSGASGALIRKHLGSVAGSRFGFAVTGCGDVDGDGRADVAVGAYGESAVRCFSGASGALLWSFTGNKRSEIGEALAPAGDFDGDGTPDLLVGNHSGGDASLVSGRTGTEIDTISDYGAYDYGAPLGVAGDLDHDGALDYFVSRGSTTGKDGRVTIWSYGTGKGGGSPRWTRLFQIDSTSSGHDSEFFGTAVRSAGDVNGDGYDDLAIGAPGMKAGNGVTPGGVVLISGFDASVLRTIRGCTDGESFGAALACPDLDGNGAPDLVVGAPSSDLAGTDGGIARASELTPLCLTMSPLVALDGDTLTAEIAGGEMGELTLLSIVDLSGTPTFVLLYVDFLQDFGRLSVSDTVPPGLAGLDAAFQAFATRRGPGTMFSNRETIWFK